ncbi:MAG TPA: hypothetical protein VGM02_04675 [Acidobacteriaceae bacterium]|jgi:hypothetical protein
MSDFLAMALGLVFALVVCLLALHALLSPWLRLRRAPATAVTHPGEKPSAPPRDTSRTHTA